MKETITINGRKIGAGQPVYIIAEMSNNHHQNFEEAVKIVEAAKEAGADAVKLQTYTPDTITIACDKNYFRIKGTPWDGLNLHDLYKSAYMPWEWHAELKEVADRLSLDLFSSPFDAMAVDLLEGLAVPAFKIASFEIVDLGLIRYVARTGKPIIMSTGMASLCEIEEAVRTILKAGGEDIVLLKCTSAYPSPPEEMNLCTIPSMSEVFNLPVGLSDHSMGIAVPVTAVALSACVIEKHLTLSRSIPGPDSAFALEPAEFKAMVAAVRMAEKALGEVSYEPTEKEKESRVFRRSLFVVEDMEAGQVFSPSNVRSIRPSYGLRPRYLEEILGRIATRRIERGTPLSWDLVGASQ